MNARKLSLIAILAIVGCEPSRVAEVAQEPAQATEQPVQQQPSNDNVLVGKIVGVVDGDTADLLLVDKTTVRIRLASIDAPERGQPFGNASKAYLSDLTFGKDVSVISQGEDRYGRIIGTILLGDSRTAGRALVTAGLAHHYVEYDPDNKVLAAAEREARAAKRGLWSDPRHVVPWEWRKLSKAERDLLR